MAEDEYSKNIEVVREKTARQIYSKEILGLDNMPKSPEELPQECLVDKRYLGEIFEATDDNAKIMLEHQQVVRIKDGKPLPMKRIENRLPHAAFYHMKMSGQQLVEGLPIVHYHTHPAGIHDFSIADIQIYNTRPAAYMEVMSSKVESDGSYMIQGIFRTHATPKGSINPIRNFSVGRKLDKMWNEALLEGEIPYEGGTTFQYHILDDWQYNRNFLSYLEEQGFGWYYFRSDSSKPLDEQLQDGKLPFKRVIHDMFQTELNQDDKLRRLQNGPVELDHFMKATT